MHRVFMCNVQYAICNVQYAMCMYACSLLNNIFLFPCCYDEFCENARMFNIVSHCVRQLSNIAYSARLLSAALTPPAPMPYPYTCLSWWPPPFSNFPS